MKKYGIDFKHAFDLKEGRGEFCLIFQLARSVKSFPHLPMFNAKIIEALENYKQGLFVDLEVNSNLKKMIFGKMPFKDMIKIACKGNAKLEWLACLPKLLQIDENVGGFMKLMGFVFSGL